MTATSTAPGTAAATGRRSARCATAGAAALVGLLSLVGGPTGQASAAGRFTTQIDNAYLPFVPGTRMVYRVVDGDEHGREVVRVTHRTRLVDGVRVRVVRDRAFDGAGRLVEDTRDFYAQDHAGNVWYFGERTATVRNGTVVSTEGSWLAGRHGAKPGIVMEAHPRIGDEYAQEDAPGVAEDRARVLRLDATRTVPYGTFHHLLVTKDFSPLEPAVVEHKFYAKGVGSILEKEVKGGQERLRLVRVTHD